LNDVGLVHFCDVTVEGERWPVFGWTIETSAGRVLVDTGMVDSTPELDAEWGPVLREWDVPDVVAVINTHLHFDHCGGNRLFAGVPIYVQARERAAAREPGYTVPEWVEFDGAAYVELDGEAELAPGLRVLPTPGHSEGHQSVLVDTEDGLVVIAGDVAYTWRAFHAPENESAARIVALEPRRVWLAHAREPWPS
jgi:N-acyl homoserine lactone hydrolase